MLCKSLKDNYLMDFVLIWYMHPYHIQIKWGDWQITDSLAVNYKQFSMIELK